MFVLKCHLVAEIACNHDGDFGKAIRMVRESRLAGAHWVKVQYYRLETLGVTDPYLVRRLQECAFSLIEIRGLKEVAESEGLDFICTAMGDVETLMDYVRFVEPRLLKVREADGRKGDFVRAAVDTGVPGLISFDPTKGHWRVPTESWRSLYCLPRYPPSEDDLDFFHLKHFDGFSSHFPNLRIPSWAWAFAKATGKEEFWLEIHVREDKDNDCLDYSVSLSLSDFGRVASLVNEDTA